MSDHAAFVRAILNHPDDDGPRLVYADWLEECGDPRGAWLRWATAVPPGLVAGALVAPAPLRITCLRRSADGWDYRSPGEWPASLSRLVAAACLRRLAIAGMVDTDRSRIWTSLDIGPRRAVVASELFACRLIGFDHPSLAQFGRNYPVWQAVRRPSDWPRNYSEYDAERVARAVCQAVKPPSLRRLKAAA